MFAVLVPPVLLLAHREDLVISNMRLPRRRDDRERQGGGEMEDGCENTTNFPRDTHTL